MVYVCVLMPKEVYEKEKVCVHAAEDAGSSAEKNIVHFAESVKHCSHYGAKHVGH